MGSQAADCTLRSFLCKPRARSMNVISTSLTRQLCDNSAQSLPCLMPCCDKARNVSQLPSTFPNRANGHYSDEEACCCPVLRKTVLTTVQTIRPRHKGRKNPSLNRKVSAKARCGVWGPFLKTSSTQETAQCRDMQSLGWQGLAFTCKHGMGTGPGQVGAAVLWHSAWGLCRPCTTALYALCAARL